MEMSGIFGGRMPGLVRRTGRMALDFLLPPLCLACTKPVSSPGAICPRCWTGMDFITRPYCERLGTPFETDLGAGILSLKAIAEPPVFGRARAVARYDGTSRFLVHRLKYSDRLDLADAMGGLMARSGAEVLDGADVLVPVPLHVRRLLGRRFNQAGELAKAVARQSQVPVRCDVLVRRKPTRSQVGLSLTERARNVTGAFAVLENRRADVQGRRVVLVDDVMTTGSTLNAASRVLKRSGAASVDVLVFALVAERV